MADEDFIALTSEPTPDTNNTGNQKRKLDDMEEHPLSSTVDVAAVPDSSEVDGGDGGQNGDDEPSKRPRLDELASLNGHKAEEDNGHTEENTESEAGVEGAETAVGSQNDGNENAEELTPEEENGAQPVTESEQQVVTRDDNSEEKDTQVISSGDAHQEITEKTPGEEFLEPASEVSAEGVAAAAGHDSLSGSSGTTRRIEIPNNKVGVLIGKSGDTIKYLQINSGARIQITRDADADPNSATRPVELVGSLESLNKAESLIKDVIAEADAGGSPSLVARGFSAAMAAGFTEIELPVPGDKVGLVIGRGGDTIRNMQTRSGARIQLIPQNVPGEQQSKEKKVKITGDKKQVELAKDLIMEVMNQLPGRPSQFANNNYSQQGYRPRGPGGAPQWGNRGPPTQQPMPYEYHQRGPYPSQNQQYPSQSYGNYPYHGPPRNNFGPSGWEQRPPAQGPPHGGGYDYYGQGGGHAANTSGPHPGHVPGHASGPSMGPNPLSQANYNYAQPRSEYLHSNPYPQSAPPAQNYGHGYGEPKYDGQPPVQQPYGGQGYAPHQQGYAPQQQYNRPPSYGMPSQGAPPQGYTAPTTSQPADTYQAPPAAAQPYSQNVQPHQQYPYAAGQTAQPPYGAAPVANDGYQQPQPAAGYAQQTAQPVPSYGQQAGAYAQSAAPNPGYGQYPPAGQPGYGDQSTVAAPTSSAAYGYQDPSAYAAAQPYSTAPAPAAHQGYGQPTAAQPVYDPSTAQPGVYAAPAAAAAAPAAYGKTVSPQPGYPQYDASQQQMYAAPR